MDPSRMRASNRREAVIRLREYPSLREWKPRDWAVAAVLVALGFLLEAVLPSRVWGLLGVAAFVSYFFLVSSRRRRVERQRAPGEDWTPRMGGPGTES